MGRISVAVLLWLILFSVQAQNDSKAPISSDYQNYLEHPELYKAYRPSPFNVHYSDLELKSAEMLPEAFDLRDVNGTNYISSVKDQGIYGTCWAFAASASLESYWLKLGLPEVALSVRNFANCHGFEWSPFDGGNAFIASAYLTRLSGPVYESADPYSNMNVEGCKSITNKSDYPAYVTQMYTATGIENIKQLIMKYGAVATSMSTNNFYTHYNSTSHTYYYNDVQPIDHGVTIIGWDDNMIVNNISTGNPPGKGAWIIKNSWGADWGLNGYFYVSYYDKYVGKEISLYPGRIETEEVDTLYLYDRLGAITSWGLKDAENREIGYALVKFHAPKTQVINRIGSYVNTGGTIMDAVIAKNWDGAELLDTIEVLPTKICRFPGYHSFEMASEIDSGDFYVQIRYETPGYNWPIPIETVESGFSNPRIEPVGYEWISSDGISWEDVGITTDNDFDLCVRAYAKNMSAPVAGIVAERPNYCINNDITLINTSVGNVDSFKWILYNENVAFDTLMSYTTDEDLTYHINDVGFIDAKLIAYSLLGNDTITKYQVLEVVSEPEIFMINGTGSDIVARGKPVTIIAHGADDYIWPATSDYPETAGAILTFDIQSPDLWIKVKGMLGNCETWDSIEIQSVVVPYDDIADAYELTINVLEGPFSNAYATVQANEPAPEEGDCNNQIDWCSEGGLQNSIWLKFKAPMTGKASIISTGFDNQLALYDAVSTGTWEDIMSGNKTDYTLLAANDDAHSSDYSAEIFTVSNLTPGKTYWIQMDGSAGGETGEAYIQVKTELPTFDDYPVNVYPSIILDTLIFDLKGMTETGADLNIYDLNGRVVFNKHIDRSITDQTIYDETKYGMFYLKNPNLPRGIYIIEVKSDNFHYINKFVY
ncbi:C1 family peptidase [Saccharicrinis sp. FJH2]|uniref:C1 family peptidase n=1 Tax=Saccharicrinis sp. FJH65 TaxID=3344659 RepID=UPI0035F338E7